MLHDCKTNEPRMKSWGRFNPEKILGELDQHPELWNENRGRTYGTSPHREADDIWFRYNDIGNLDPKNPEKFSQLHESVWYPNIDKVPSLKGFVEFFARCLGAETIGGILVTRIPPGKQIYWHSDSGWHAEAHRKFLVVLRGNPDQTFEFEGEIMRSEQGECFEFQNQYKHRVLNPTDKERISLIICLRNFRQGLVK